MFREGLKSKSRSQNCQDGWTSAGEYCYFVSDEQAVWNVAETKCQQMHAHLLSVTDNDEYAKILEMRSFRGANDYVWIGLHRLKLGSCCLLFQIVLFLDDSPICG